MKFLTGHRFWLHFPVGVLCAWLFTVNPILAVLNAVSFLVYEVLNEWRKADHSYKDVVGFCFGLAVGSIILGILSYAGR